MRYGNHLLPSGRQKQQRTPKHHLIYRESTRRRAVRLQPSETRHRASGLTGRRVEAGGV